MRITFKRLQELCSQLNLNTPENSPMYRVKEADGRTGGYYLQKEIRPGVWSNEAHGSTRYIAGIINERYPAQQESAETQLLTLQNLARELSEVTGETHTVRPGTSVFGGFVWEVASPGNEYPSQLKHGPFEEVKKHIETTLKGAKLMQPATTPEPVPETPYFKPLFVLFDNPTAFFPGHTIKEHTEAAPPVAFIPKGSGTAGEARQKAYAHLFGASEDLFDALRFCKSVLEAGGLVERSEKIAHQKATAAIKKALGQE